MTGGELSSGQGWARIFEQNAVVSLLGHGINVLRSAKYIDPVLDPVLTTWSIGTEKLLKLSLGHFELQRSGTWMSSAQMKTEFRHKIVRMDEVLRHRIRTWAISNKKHYILSLLDDVEANPIWTALSEVLDLYGQSGRFHHLDVLGGAQVHSDSPHAAWRNVESIANDARSVQDSNGGLSSWTISELDEHALAVNRLIAESTYNWWMLISRAFTHKFCGGVGQSFGSAISPAMAIPPIKPGGTE